VNVETEREKDGRWIAEEPELPGVLVYAQTREEAIRRVEALALRVIADSPPVKSISRKPSSL
jgi:predicted RNase H-like HicB family nuclease